MKKKYGDDYVNTFIGQEGEKKEGEKREGEIRETEHEEGSLYPKLEDDKK